MTYKQIVDSVKEAVDRHRILMDFGYGALTDIKTVDEGETDNVDYPYLFLNPTASTRTGQTVTYRFNMIVMDVAQDDKKDKYHNYLKRQSECQQYIDDVLGYLRFKSPLSRFDLTLNMTLTPFKERFQDTLAGMTATLEIQVPAALDFCDAPYYQYLFTGSINDFNVEPDPTGRVIGYQSQDDPNGLYTTCRYQTAKLTDGEYRLEIEAKVKFTEDKPAPPPVFLRPHRVSTTDCSASGIANRTLAPRNVDGWPAPNDAIQDQVYDVKLVYYWNTAEIGPIPTGYKDSMNLSLKGSLNPADESLTDIYDGTIKIYGL